MVKCEVQSRSRTDFVDITRDVAEAVRKLGVEHGAVLVFNPHTTAAVTINEGADPDVVRAVLPVRWADPVAALAWVQALAGYRDQADFQLLATGDKRCKNILKGEVLELDALEDCLQRWAQGGSGAGGEDFTPLVEPAERDLRQKITTQLPELMKSEKNGDFASVFGILSGLGPAIDRYFEEVRVNAEEPEIRTLRHVFLREIHGLFSRYADFTAVAAGEK